MDRPRKPSVWSTNIRSLTGADKKGHRRSEAPRKHVALISCEARNQMIFSTCLALRRAQRIECEVSEAEEARAACAEGSQPAGADKERHRRSETPRQHAQGLIPHIFPKWSYIVRKGVVTPLRSQSGQIKEVATPLYGSRRQRRTSTK